MKRKNRFLEPFKWIGGYFALVGAGLVAVLYYIVALPIISMVQMFRMLFGASFARDVQDEGRLYYSKNLLRMVKRNGMVETGPGRLLIELLGSVDRITTPAKGSVVKRGDTLINLEFEDKDLQLASPLQGKVVAVNSMVLQNPEVLATMNPEYLWVVRIKPENLAADIAGWLPEDAFGRITEAFNARLLRFFGPGTAMADGGTIVRGLARNMTKDQWNQLKAELSLE